VKWNKTIQKFPILLFACIQALIYGIIASGQVLGFSGLYRRDFVFLLTILLTAGSLVYYLSDKDLFHQFLPDKSTLLKPPVKISLVFGGILIFVMLAAVPMLRWPESPIGQTLTWDAGAYHFPKAVELYRSGSAWDLSVPYGDYPFGYESMLALGLTLSGDESWFSPIHLLISLYFVLSFWLLGCRYSKLPHSLLFFISVCVLISGKMVIPEESQLISGFAYTIGKNDFLLGTAVLAMILHAPIGTRQNESFFHLPGMAINSMLAVSVKPNGAIPVLVLWLITFYILYKNNGWKISSPLITKLAVAGLVMLPGILWAIRNFVILGRIYTPAANTLMAESIASNITNPYLYTPNFPFLIFILTIGISLISIVIVWKTDFLSRTIVGCSLLLLITFVFTPATAFHKFLDVPAHVAWRFGITLLLYNFLIAILLMEKWIAKMLDWMAKRQMILLKMILVWGFIALVLWRGGWLLQKEPQNRIILRDEYAQSVGENGYYSAYDFVQKNIRNSVIHIENGVIYYVYGPGYTNTPTKLQYPLEMEDQVSQPVPDYFVIFKPDDIGADFPPSLESSEWLQKWELIYSDREGRVYRKIS
jgi:hypothetical protein